MLYRLFTSYHPLRLTSPLIRVPLDATAIASTKLRLSRICKADFVTVAFILAFGICAIAAHPRRVEFGGEDVFYADAAQSLLESGFYGVQGIPETTQPPGLPLLLATLFGVFGYSYSVCVIADSVFLTLGFLVFYAILRQRLSPTVPGIICFLLLSSVTYFAWATRMVYPCFFYFFTTMAALFSAEKYRETSSLHSQLFWGVVLCVSIVASLLIATGTIVLLGAMVAVLLFTTISDKHSALPLLRRFVPVILVGLAVQLWWMSREPAPREWPLAGYPGSYLEQVQLKNGNYPELGMARFSDLPVRIFRNMTAESDIVTSIVIRHGLNRTKLATVGIPILLSFLGWISSVLRNRGRCLLDWYFAGYQFVYLLWPWRMEVRFLLPIVPLACLYLWEGVLKVFAALQFQARLAGSIAFPITGLLTMYSATWMYRHNEAPRVGLPPELPVVVWSAFSTCAFLMMYTGRSIFSFSQRFGTRGFTRKALPNGSPARLFRFGVYLLVGVLFAAGMSKQMQIARENLATTDSNNAEGTDVVEILPQEVDAGVWLRSHTDANDRVMARHWPTVRHFSQRKLVWFPPISDPEILFNGIVKHGIDYIVVIRHESPYYLPDDNYCFDHLFGAHPRNFQEVFQRPNLRIFKVANIRADKVTE